MIDIAQLPPIEKLDEFLDEGSRERMMLDAIRAKILRDAKEGIYPDDTDAYRIVGGTLYDGITNNDDMAQYNADLKLLKDYIRKRTASDCEEYIWHDGFNSEESLIVVGINMLLTDVKKGRCEAHQPLTDLFKRYVRNTFRQARKLDVYSLRQAQGFMERDEIIGSITDLSIAYITCRINRIPIDDTGWLVVDLITKEYPLIRKEEEEFWEGFDNDDVRCLTDFIQSIKEDVAAVPEAETEIRPEQPVTQDPLPNDAKDEEIRMLRKKIQELRYKADRQRELYESERAKVLRLEKERGCSEKKADENAEAESTPEIIEESAPGPSSDEMIQTIRDRRITIIGGHENWVYKLRNLFPKWTYLGPAEQGSMPVSVISGTEVIYFFSNHICHPQYNRFLNAARIQKIPVKYISKVNVPDNIRQIYGDVSCM